MLIVKDRAQTVGTNKTHLDITSVVNRFCWASQLLYGVETVWHVYIYIDCYLFQVE